MNASTTAGSDQFSHLYEAWKPFYVLHAGSKDKQNLVQDFQELTAQKRNATATDN
jgi:hypothetical protein